MKSWCVIYCFEWVLRFWSCCIFLWRSRLTNWSKAKGSIPDHDPLTTNIVSVSSASESSKKTAITLCAFCPSHDFVQHNTASLEQLLGLCLYLVYPSGPAPAAFASFTRPIGPVTVPAVIQPASLSLSPPIHPPSPSALISSLLLPLQLRGLQLWPWIGITSHQADKYQNVNDSRVEAEEVRCTGIEHPMSRASRGTKSNWSGEKTAEVPGRPMVDDLTALSSPGWLGNRQHSQQAIHNGDNVRFCSSHSWWGFSCLFVCSFPPCWKEWRVSMVLSMSRRPFHQISHAHLCFGFLRFYWTFFIMFQDRLA